MRKYYIGIFIVTLIVIIAIFYGLTTTGSPFQARQAQFDSKRVEDIQQIKYAVENYHTTYRSLPSNLETMQNSSVTSLKDPETSAPYAYNVLGPFSYQICATFDMSSDKESNIAYYYNPIGSHPAGYYCYSFSVPAAPVEVTVYQTPTPYVYTTPVPIIVR